MSRKYGNLGSIFLKAVGEATGFFSWPIPHTEAWRYEQIYGSRKKFLNGASYLKRRGFVKTVTKQGKHFLQLTAKGELEILMQKAGIEKTKKWDGKWRLVVFDIPEDANSKRDLLRRLLKRNQFTKLQASVFISPYPLNREAVGYLKQSGLISYIRLLRVEEIDDDRALKKKFGLS